MKKVKVIFNGPRSFIIKVLIRRHINIYNVSNDVYTINYSDLNKIPSIYIKSYEYIGVEKYKKKINNNKYFLITICLSFLLLIIASHMIFKVEVLHNDKELRGIIYEYLKDNGVSPFTFRKKYSKLDKIKKGLKETYSDKIDWVEIERDGVIYKVKVEERIVVKNEKTRPLCDIISTKDANILSYNISHGEMIKELGDFVSKGETLVSGTIHFNEKATLQTCAEGEIYGNTWYKINVNLPLEHIVNNVTKKRILNIGIEKGSKYKRIFRVHFKNYKVKKRRIISFGKVNIYLETVNEIEGKVKRFNEKEGIKEASKRAQKSLNRRIGPKGKILSEKVLQSDVYDSIMYIEFFYSVSEPIGKQLNRELPKKGVEEDEVTK